MNSIQNIAEAKSDLIGNKFAENIAKVNTDSAPDDKEIYSHANR